MAIIVNLFAALGLQLARLFAAFGALAGLLGLVLRQLRGEGTLKERLGAALLASSAQLQVFAVLRGLLPNLVIGKRFIACYENSGSALVTRDADVRAVLLDDDNFEVVYGPRMAMITGGDNFFLGMQPTARYQQDVSLMRTVARRDDVASRIKPFTERAAADIVAAASGRLDVPQDLSLPVPARMVGDYFGLPGPDPLSLIDWTTTLFWYLFADLGADPAMTTRAEAAAANFRAYIDGVIAARSAAPSGDDDLVNRCLALSGRTPGLAPTAIRNNLIGLMIGAVPTNSKAAVLALEWLLDHPEQLAGAQAAARADDDRLLAQYIWEALRFNPFSPVVYRRAIRDVRVAPGSLRSRLIPKGTMLFASTASAMHDPQRVPKPAEFRSDRPFELYLHWGYALHTCFGDHMNRVTIPGVLKPLLKQKNLRRAPGPAGQVDAGGTPFPQHFVVEFDRA